MYDIAAPLLYRDCLADDFSSLAAGLRTSENSDRITRLQIYHQFHQAEATYAEILSQDRNKKFNWQSLFIKSELDDIPLGVDLMSIIEEVKALVLEGRRIRAAVTAGLTVFPNLRIVSMGGIGGRIYNCLYETTGLEDKIDIIFDNMFNGEFVNGRQALPHALLDLPTVQHYCQSVAYGPLALPNKVIMPKSTIQTFTSHQPGTPVFFSYKDCHPDNSPPIVLGAINRYYVDCACNFALPLDTDHLDDYATILRPIETMFYRPVITIADPNTGAPISLNGELSSEMIEGTEIEIYNFVRTYQLHKKYQLSKNKSKRGAMFEGGLPPRSLAFFQDRLEQLLPKVWKGRVKLGNWEDAPLCSACGYDLGEEIEGAKAKAVKSKDTNGR